MTAPTPTPTPTPAGLHSGTGAARTRPAAHPARRMSRAARLRLLAASAAAALTLPLGAALPAGATSPAATPGVFVGQGQLPTVYSGADPIDDYYLAVLPSTLQGQVSAVVAFAPGQFPAGTDTAALAAHLHSSCAIGDGPYQPCAWQGGPAANSDLDGWLRLRLPTTDAAAAVSYHVRTAADAGTLPADRLLTGWAEVSTADGAVLGDGVAQLRYSTGLPDPYDRGQLYAVDTAGVLWRYETTGNSSAPLRPRARIGRGWDAYDAITPLGSTTAGGSGDVVARDRSGVLWYYTGTGNGAQPFAPRMRVGAGWNIYTSVVGIGSEYAGGGDGVVARDKQGVLWYYERTSPDAGFLRPRVRVGAGWNVYNTLSTYGNGIVGRATDGHLWSYAHGPGNFPPFGVPVDAGPGWGGYTAFSPLFVSTANPDVLAARDAGGRLWVLSDRDGTRQIPARPQLVGGGWNIYTRLF